MKTKQKTIVAATAVAFLILGLAGCGGGGSNNDADPTPPPPPANSLGLNGTWGGIAAHDEDTDTATISVTAEDRSMTRFVIDGVDQVQTASVTELQPDVFKYLTSTDVNGAILVDSGKSYGFLGNEVGEFGVVQKGASAPYGDATILDLDGTWSGFFVAHVEGFADDEYARAPVTAVCTSGLCAITFIGPAITRNGDIVDAEVEGVISDAIFERRTSLVLDGTYTNTRGASGLTTAILSKDKRFVGIIACQTSAFSECEFGALVKD